jgi:uncharacterized protein YuzE
MDEVRPVLIGALRVQYNDEADVLYISIGAPREAVTLADDAGLLIRKDPRTHDVVGVTILDYEDSFRHLEDLGWLDEKALSAELCDLLRSRPSFRKAA